jgi:hypothetical protein
MAMPIRYEYRSFIVANRVFLETKPFNELFVAKSQNNPTWAFIAEFPLDGKFVIS